MKKAIVIGLGILVLGSAVPAMAHDYRHFDRRGDRIDARLDASEEIGSTIGSTPGVTGSTSGSMLKASGSTTGSTPWRQRHGRKVKIGWPSISIVKAIASKPNWTVAVTGLKTVTTIVAIAPTAGSTTVATGSTAASIIGGIFNRWWGWGRN